MAELVWPKNDFSAVPYRVFVDQDIFEREQKRIFRGPVWCHLGLEAEVAKPRDFITTFLGDTSVVVNRDDNGELHGFVNRCMHRGSTLVREPWGQRRVHTCVYHHWCYNLQGQLIGVPFERGIDGKGGMPDSFDKTDHRLQAIRLDTYRGVIFGSMSADAEPLETYLDEPMRDNLDRLFAKPDRNSRLYAPAHDVELEALLGERVRSVPRRFVAPVCHHLRAVSHHPGGRHRSRSARSPYDQLLHLRER